MNKNRIKRHATKKTNYMLFFFVFIKPRRACARGTVVVLSVTTLAAAYLVLKSQVKCHRVLHGVFNRCIVWILLKMLRSKVLA